MPARVPRLTIKCRICGKSREILPSVARKGKAQFCSHSCQGKVSCLTIVSGNKLGKWNDIHRVSISRLHNYQNSDESLHPRWKGDEVGYYGTHDWITKHYGQPIGCDECGLNDSSRKYHWANLSHEYKRDRSDFKRMCVSCHRKYDYAYTRRKNAEKKDRV